MRGQYASYQLIMPVTVLRPGQSGGIKYLIKIQIAMDQGTARILEIAFGQLRFHQQCPRTMSTSVRSSSPPRQGVCILTPNRGRAPGSIPSN